MTLTLDTHNNFPGNYTNVHLNKSLTQELQETGFVLSLVKKINHLTSSHVFL